MKLSTRRVVLLLTILLINLIIRADSDEQIIELPLNDVVIELKITELVQVDLKIKCLNYDALQGLNGSVFKQNYWDLEYRFSITFTRCYNNKMSHANYKTFQLEEFLKTAPSNVFEDISIYVDKFAAVDENVFLKNFNFSKYTSIYFEGVGFESTEFLSNLIDNAEIEFKNCHLIDFSHFTGNKLTNFVSTTNSILNLNPTTLGKLPMLSILILDNNSYEDDVFNVPNLFEFNSEIQFILIGNSTQKLVLHDNLFSGLDQLDTLILINLQIEHVSENLFSGLPNIKTISLEGNQVKTLHENAFSQNPNLSYLYMDGNNLLEFSGTTNKLNFAGSDMHVSLKRIIYSSVAKLESILNNPNVQQLFLSRFGSTEITLEDFGIIKSSSRQVTVNLSAGPTYFNTSSTSAENLTKLTSDYRAVIEIHVHANDRMCRECTLIKSILSSDQVTVYSADDKLDVLFEFSLTLDCLTAIMSDATVANTCI